MDLAAMETPLGFKAPRGLTRSSAKRAAPWSGNVEQQEPTPFKRPALLDRLDEVARPDEVLRLEEEVEELRKKLDEEQEATRKASHEHALELLREKHKREELEIGLGHVQRSEASWRAKYVGECERREEERRSHLEERVRLMQSAREEYTAEAEEQSHELRRTISSLQSDLQAAKKEAAVGTSQSLGKALGGGMVPYGGGSMDAYGGAMVPAPPMDRGDMSFDQRAQISAGIARLGPNDLSKAVKIIQDNNPSLASGDGHIEVDINALDNPTLWRLWDYLEKCNGPKSKKGSGGGKRGSAANSLLSNIDAASMRNPHQLQQVRNARSSLASAADGGASGGGVFSGADDGADDGWMSEGDSDGGKAPTGGGGGGAGGGMWQSFQQTKESHLRQQQQAQQQQARQQEAAAAETERARRAAQDQRQLAQRQRDEQRQREREERERQRQGAGIDMMGQQKAMTEADQWGGDGFDEYGLGGF